MHIAAPAPGPAALDAGTQPYIRVRGLTKRFGAFTALSSIDLDIAKSEFVCFLGPSGCGKTTLLRAIAGLDPQDEGTIHIGGRDVSRLPPAARDFGIVFQSYALFPNLSVARNVGYGLVNRGRNRADIEARVAELLALVGLPDQGTKYPSQLSGGQQQRVALARALATSPGLLLLDEPLSALDARVRVRLRDEIKALQRRLGVTTIMVTHDQEEAMAMADRIVVMNHGVIEQIGTAADVYVHPRTPFVADFVGHMMFIEGTLATATEVAVAGLSLTVAPQDAALVGRRVKLGLRPEEVRLRAGVGATVNRLDAVITDMAYLGSFCRLTLAPQREPSLALTADVSSNDVRDLDIAVGKVVAAVLPPNLLRLYPFAAGDTA